MRLGIRRKLIGTLILVGLFPLVLSLVVILGGGAAMQLSRIRSNYDDIATDSSNQITSKVQSELDGLLFMSRIPATVAFVREQNRKRALIGPPTTLPGSKVPAPDATARELDRLWPQLKAADPVLNNILHNSLADHLALRSGGGTEGRQFLATNAYGELIAADVKSGNFYQADEGWWQTTFSEGKGRVYVSSLVTNPANGAMVLEIAVPVYDRTDVARTVIGVIKEKIELSWLRQLMRELPGQATGQLVDLESGRTIFAPEPGAVTRKAEEFYRSHRVNPHVSIVALMLGDIVLGLHNVPLDTHLGLSPDEASVPHWVVLVSKPSSEAMDRVYQLAMIVAGIGVALILVLFILGVAISNREIIMPILRLREATAAVGRGELNVRLMSSEMADPTFRGDELGSLARDFDEMTRQLQRNVNALARSNEAKRRFMELAGHELRTPVTYILGVCQLAQRQIQQEATEAPGAPRGVTTSARPDAATAAALAKISAKAQRLSRIIDNLLKLVTNDQFTTRLDKSPVDIRALILQVTSDYRPFVQERKQQLAVDVAENLPSIEADRDKLEDVLNNLISNAVRFSPDGGRIAVGARMIVGDMLEILIHDSGPGIKQEDLTNLFEPFYTGSDILHHHSGEMEFGSKGIGLGLAIVRRFVELHGGVVRAQSSPQGTQFQILLPLLKEETGAPGSSEPSPSN
jgi:signal transduction histidine kinase